MHFNEYILKSNSDIIIYHKNQISEDSFLKFLIPKFYILINGDVNMNNDIDNNKFVKVSEVYGQVLEHYGYTKEDKTKSNGRNKVDYEHKQRNLRNKYKFLMQNVILRDARCFRQKSADMIPKNDMPIIRELLFYSISDKPEDEIIVRWFNNKLDLSVPKNSWLLYKHIKPIIMNPLMVGEVDDVTYDEWDKTIRASINYNTAYNTAKIMQQIENFRDCTLPLNQTICFGEIISTEQVNDSGDITRNKILDSNEFSFNLKKETVYEALEKVISQNDYLEIMKQVMQILNDHAIKSAIEKIKTVAMSKELGGFKKADENIELQSCVSEYVIWYQNIYEFLKNNRDICKEIEKFAKTDNILDFFKMDDR